ncbi:MAG: substrate-binding domain-containing protein, partial [Acetobacteraceae bacterium]
MNENERPARLGRRTWIKCGGALGTAAVAGAALGGPSTAFAAAQPLKDASGHGMKVTKLAELAPFRPGSVIGTKPNLPRRVAWANSSNAEFFIELGNSIKAAAHDRGLAYVTAIANNDSATNIAQINSFLQVGIAALCIQPIDAAAQALVMQRAIDQGIDVMSLVTPPSTIQCVANQYEVGYAQGAAAADWIKEHLGGKAQVVIFNLNTISVLIARDQG